MQPNLDTIDSLFKADVTKLSNQQLEEMLVKLDLAQKRSNEVWGVYNFRPHQKQEIFLYAKDKQDSVPYIRLVESGNKWGKCVTFQTLIPTTYGHKPIGELYKLGLPFDVYSWNGEKTIIARACPPIKKEGFHQCYKITMNKGQFIEVADRHRILTSFGWLTAQRLYAFSQVLQESNLEPYPSIHVSGVCHWSEKQSNCLLNYLMDSHQYDEPLQIVLDNGQVSFSLSDDVLKYIPVFLRMGVQDNIASNILYLKLGLLSILDALRLNADRFSVSLKRGVYKLFQQFQYGFLKFLQLSTAGASQLQSCDIFYSKFPEIKYNRLAYKDTSSWNKIDSITFIPELQEVYDFTVPKYHNYYAVGLIHHNTHSGVAEDLAHMVGFRPWLKKDDPNYWIKHGGKRIIVPNRGLLVGETITHSIMEKIYPTSDELLPKSWGGKFKKNSQGHITNLKLTKGPGKGSESFFRSYDQPAKDFEGIDYHWAHMDEPPPEPHMNAILRGLIAYSGRAWLTMTPLREPYIYDRFSRKADNHKIFVITGTIWDNAIKNGGYMDEQAIMNYLEDLPPEEREAREFGKWKHFAGVVYKILDRSIHEIDDFIVPKNWTPYEGIDPADGKDTKWLFFRVSDEEFIGADGKKMYRAYCTGYLSLPPENTINEMVRQARIKRAEFGYEKPKWIVLDAKYGIRRVKTEEMTTSWEKELKKADHGVRYILSESKPGDVELGIKLVKDYLTPKYSTIHQKKLPSLVFFKENCAGDGGPIYEMLRYRRDINGKLVDEDDDCPDIVRYFCMKRPKYRNYAEKQSRWPKMSYQKVA